MNNDLSDVHQLLLKYGIYVYEKDRLNMLTMMKLEINELHKYQLISNEEFLHASTIIRKELN